MLRYSLNSNVQFAFFSPSLRASLSARSSTTITIPWESYTYTACINGSHCATTRQINTQAKAVLSIQAHYKRPGPLANGLKSEPVYKRPEHRHAIPNEVYHTALRSRRILSDSDSNSDSSLKISTPTPLWLRPNERYSTVKRTVCHSHFLDFHFDCIQGVIR